MRSGTRARCEAGRAGPSAGRPAARATSDVTAVRNDEPLQDSTMGLETVRDIEPTATRNELRMCKRGYESHIVVATYASLHFDGDVEIT